jgi:hypothetical protein
MLKKIINLIKHVYSSFLKKMKKHLKSLSRKWPINWFRSGPARSDLTDRGEGLGQNLLHPSGPNAAQNAAHRPLPINGWVQLSGEQNRVPVSPPAPNPKLLLILISPRRRAEESEVERRLCGDPASAHMAAALPWVRSPTCALSVEESAAVEPFHSRGLRFLWDGWASAIYDDDAEFLPETGVDGDDGSDLGWDLRWSSRDSTASNTHKQRSVLSTSGHLFPEYAGSTSGQQCRGKALTLGLGSRFVLTQHLLPIQKPPSL